MSNFDPDGGCPSALRDPQDASSGNVCDVRVQVGGLGGIDTLDLLVSPAANVVEGIMSNAPVLDASQIVVLDAVTEDAGPPVGAVGTLVSSIVDLNSTSGGLDNVTDADGGALTGIALTDTDSSHGTWFYTINGGSTWTAVGAVSEASALLLAANADTRLYFQPSPDFNGTVDYAISFLAWDQTSGSNGATADVTANGGSTAFSLSHSPSNVLVSGLGGAAGFGENSLPAADEAKQVVDLTSIFGAQGIDFFGTHYTDVTIDNNGIVYFGGGLSVAANRDHYAFYNEATGPSTAYGWLEHNAFRIDAPPVGGFTAEMATPRNAISSGVDTRPRTSKSIFDKSRPSGGCASARCR